MNHLFTGLTAITLALPALAQPDCSQIIQASFTSGVQENVVVFTNTSLSQFPQATTYQWSFGDGGSTAGNTVTHVYDQPGTYLVCLYAVVENCVDTACHEVTVGGNDPCLVLADVITELGPQQGGVSFAYGNVPSYANTQWFFGDGTSSDAAQGFHQYQEPGIYTVCLWTWFIIEGTADTCSHETCHQVTIGGTDPCAGLQAGFSADVQGNAAQFSNSTTGTGFQTTWHWTFGDGGTGDGPQPQHQYDAPGSYLVCLTALSVYEQTGGGLITCSDSICHEVTIQGGGSPCDSLSAYFVVTAQGSLAAFTTFGGTAIGYQWNFGDGSEGDGPAPIHTYPCPGTYHACLVTWTWDPETQDTCYADHCEWVTIVGEPGPCDSLSAEFWYGSNGGDPWSVFYSASTPGGSGTHWLWSFGDGTYSDNGPQGTHTYAEPGTYELCLTAWQWIPGTQDTCSTTHCQPVVIGEGSPCDSLSAYFVVTTEENLAAFTTSGGTASGYQWTFGDGTQGDGPHPVHTYPGPGTYHACLVTWTWDPQTQDTCYADHCEWITIGQGGPCDSTFACFQWGLQEMVVQFYNCSSSNGADLHYWWSFGDGTNGDGPQPAHTYPGPGTYEVCLTVWTNNAPDSCSNTICNTLTIPGGNSPCDSLSASFTVTGIETQAVFTSYGGSAIGYQWTFGDGSEGDGPHPVHVYPGPGTYHVCLITWTWDPETQDTCYADHCEWITIGTGTPCDSLYACFQWGGQENTIQFYNCSNGNGNELSYEWSFGDGGHSDAFQPSHTFPGPGTYTICLTVHAINAPDSCSDTVCNTLVVQGGSPCDGFAASFEWSDQFNGGVHFYGFTTPMASGYLWSFGDGTQGDGMNPGHEYAEPGEYYVCLSAWLWNEQTQDSCWAEHCEWIWVAGEDSPCDSITAHFVWEPAGPAGFQFQDESETNGQDVSYWWSFGDGSYADGPGPDHTYQAPGQYQVCLTITVLNSPDSCTSTTCQVIDVQGGGSPCDALNAEFAVNVTGLEAAVHAGVNPPGTSYEWIFGDGTSGDGANTGHVYPGPGTYNVCLIVGNYDQLTQDSCFEDHCQTITIGGGNPCEGLLEAHFEFGHQGNVYTFYNTSGTQGVVVSTHWEFGDGTFGDDSQLIHTYAESGTYTVCMTISGIAPGTNDTCQATTCETIEVVVGVRDIAGASALNAWPQPFDELLQLEGADLHGLTRFTLLDMTGRVLDERSLTAQARITLHYDGLPTGAYVLRLQNQMMDRSIRVVKR